MFLTLAFAPPRLRALQSLGGGKDHILLPSESSEHQPCGASSFRGRWWPEHPLTTQHRFQQMQPRLLEGRNDTSGWQFAVRPHLTGTRVPWQRDPAPPSEDVRMDLIPWPGVKGVRSLTLMLVFENVFDAGLECLSGRGWRTARTGCDLRTRCCFECRALTSFRVSISGVCGVSLERVGRIWCPGAVSTDW